MLWRHNLAKMFLIRTVDIIDNRNALVTLSARLSKNI